MDMHFSCEYLNGKDLLEYLRLDKDNIKTDLKEINCEDMHSSQQALDRDSWRAFVNTVMNRAF
jgi:hypothetical protein